jgi:hypothetical protein
MPPLNVVTGEPLTFDRFTCEQRNVTMQQRRWTRDDAHTTHRCESAGHVLLDFTSRHTLEPREQQHVVVRCKRTQRRQRYRRHA